MRNGFLRGIFIGSVIAAVGSVLLNPINREKAKEVINQGSQMFKGVEDNIENASSWLEKSRRLFQSEESINEEVNSKDNIDKRVAFLERRLEELEHKGV